MGHVGCLSIHKVGPVTFPP